MVFHISKLSMHVPDPSHAIVTKPTGVAKNLAYEEHLLKLPNYRVTHHDEGIVLVKVLWANPTSSGGTWETKEYVRNNSPYLLRKN